jgi:hypothetical protein
MCARCQVFDNGRFIGYLGRRPYEVVEDESGHYLRPALEGDKVRCHESSAQVEKSEASGHV